MNTPLWGGLSSCGGLFGLLTRFWSFYIFSGGSTTDGGFPVILTSIPSEVRGFRHSLE
jgi:hypothetical protein